MIFTFQGREWDYDEDRTTVDQFREMKRKYKLTAKAFSDGIEDGDPDALTCLYWCMLLQNGEPAAILSDKIDFPVGPLYTAISEAQKREAEAAEAAAKAELEAEAERAASLGPTRPAGPPSPAPPSRPDTTPPPPGQLPEAPSSTGSGPATSSSSAPSTSSSSPASADLLRIRSGG